MAAFLFDEASHTYTLDGRVVPSVTQVIAPLHDLSRVPHDVLERKRALGVAVHLACELDDEGELDDDATDAVVMGYVNGWRAFRRDVGATVLMNERRLAHRGLGFAGTLDRVVLTREGLVFLVDIKTAVRMSPAYGVQLAGYMLLLEAEGVPLPAPVERKGLQLSPDGAYRLVPYINPNDRPAFCGLLAVHHWKESNK